MKFYHWNKLWIDDKNIQVYICWPTIVATIFLKISRAHYVVEFDWPQNPKINNWAWVELSCVTNTMMCIHQLWNCKDIISRCSVKLFFLGLLTVQGMALVKGFGMIITVISKLESSQHCLHMHISYLSFGYFCADKCLHHHSRFQNSDHQKKYSPCLVYNGIETHICSFKFIRCIFLSTSQDIKPLSSQEQQCLQSSSP